MRLNDNGSEIVFAMRNEMDYLQHLQKIGNCSTVINTQYSLAKS